MTVLALAAALAVVAGGAAAVTARDGRIVVLGLLVALVAAPLVSTDLPASLPIAARIVGGLLVAVLLWSVSREPGAQSAGSAIGPLAEVLAGLAAFAVGLQVAIVDPLPGPQAAQAAGFALLALSVVPLAGRDTFRLAIGVVLLTLALSLLRTAWLGAGPALEELALAGLLAGIAGGVSMLLAPAVTGVVATGAATSGVAATDRLPVAVEGRTAGSGHAEAGATVLAGVPGETPADSTGVPADLAGAERPATDDPVDHQPPTGRRALLGRLSGLRR